MMLIDDALMMLIDDALMTLIGDALMTLMPYVDILDGGRAHVHTPALLIAWSTKYTTTLRRMPHTQTISS